MSRDLVFPILNAVRTRAQDGRTLSQVLREMGHTGDAITRGATGANLITVALFRLVETNLITLTEQNENDIGERLIHAVGHQYRVALLLSEKEDNIVIKITPHFFYLQEVLKFSISDMLETQGSYQTKVRPIFGPPKEGSEIDVFVLMPFDPAMKPVYDDHIKSACQVLNLTCQRADDFFGTNQIIHDVWSAIFLSRCVIADCTGRNPNVFYEMGIAHTLGKPVILITQREDDIPFDIRHIRFIKYDYTPRAVKKLEADLQSMLLARFRDPTEK